MQSSVSVLAFPDRFRWSYGVFGLRCVFKGPDTLLHPEVPQQLVGVHFPCPRAELVAQQKLTTHPRPRREARRNTSAAAVRGASPSCVAGPAGESLRQRLGPPSAWPPLLLVEGARPESLVSGALSCLKFGGLVTQLVYGVARMPEGGARRGQAEGPALLQASSSPLGQLHRASLRSMEPGVGPLMLLARAAPKMIHTASPGARNS